MTKVSAPFFAHKLETDEIERLGRWMEGVNMKIPDAISKPTEKKRTLKGLLIQMKLADHYEERVLAEELIVNMFDEMYQEMKVLVDALELYEDINNDGGPNMAMQALDRHREKFDAGK